MLQKWRDFCRHFEGRVDDWNMGTLLRLDANSEVSDANTIIGMCAIFNYCTLEIVMRVV